MNVIKMTVMWSTCSFNSHLLNFMNKYLEGSIFTNNYVEGIAGGLAGILGAKIYARFGLRTSFILSFSMAMFGGLMVYLLESGNLELPLWFINKFAGKPRHQRYLALNYLVPKLTFIAKFGMSTANLFTYQASFSDDTIFPASQRATAIGYCQFIARGLTVLSAEVTELPKPQPIMILCSTCVIALIISFTFKKQ